MILEHTVVTTLDADGVFLSAEELMREMRFDCRPGTSPQARQFDNGRTNARKATKPSDLPMRVWLEFDRGRVNLAASIEESPRFKKRKPVLTELLMAIADAVQQLLADQQPREIAIARWSRVMATIDESERRRKRRNRILWLSFVGAVGGTIGLLSFLSYR